MDSYSWDMKHFAHLPTTCLLLPTTTSSAYAIVHRMPSLNTVTPLFCTPSFTHLHTFTVFAAGPSARTLH